MVCFNYCISAKAVSYTHLDVYKRQAIPYEYIVTEGPEPDTSYIHVADFAPILVYQSPRHVKHKLNEAMLEHCNYVRKMLARIKLSQNPQVVAELFIAWRDLTR